MFRFKFPHIRATGSGPVASSAAGRAFRAAEPAELGLRGVGPEGARKAASRRRVAPQTPHTNLERGVAVRGAHRADGAMRGRGPTVAQPFDVAPKDDSRAPARVGSSDKTEPPSSPGHARPRAKNVHLSPASTCLAGGEGGEHRLVRGRNDCHRSASARPRAKQSHKVQS
jgi:hypothetical protein